MNLCFRRRPLVAVSFCCKAVMGTILLVALAGAITGPAVYFSLTGQFVGIYCPCDSENNRKWKSYAYAQRYHGFRRMNTRICVDRLSIIRFKEDLVIKEQRKNSDICALKKFQ